MCPGVCFPHSNPWHNRGSAAKTCLKQLTVNRATIVHISNPLYLQRPLGFRFLNALVLFVGSRRASRHKLTFILFFTHPEFFLGTFPVFTRARRPCRGRPRAALHSATSHHCHHRHIGRNFDVGRLLLDPQNAPPPPSMVCQPPSRLFLCAPSYFERAFINFSVRSAAPGCSPCGFLGAAGLVISGSTCYCICS